MAVSIDDLEPGDRVEYHPIGGGAAPNITTGVVVDLIVNDKRKYSYLHSRGLVLREGEREITVHASKTEPRILIQNDKTKKVAVYKVENIVKVVAKKAVPLSALPKIKIVP